MHTDQSKSNEKTPVQAQSYEDLDDATSSNFVENENRKVKFAESLVTYAADTSGRDDTFTQNTSLLKLSNQNTSSKQSHIQLYNDESIFKNMTIFKDVVEGKTDEVKQNEGPQEAKPTS